MHPETEEKFVRHWLRVLLYASAFAPILISTAVVKAIDAGISTETISLAAIGLFATALGPLILSWVGQELESFTVQFKKIESNDHLIFAFLISYIAPFASKISAFSVNHILLFCGFILVALWMSSALPVHPLLRLRLYHFYKAEAEGGVVYGLISKRKLHSAGEPTSVKLLSHNMLLEVKP